MTARATFSTARRVLWQIRHDHRTVALLLGVPAGLLVLLCYRLAAVQATVVCTVGFAMLGLDAPHGVWLIGVLAVGNAVLGMALGLFVSAFARTEFQAVQFMPALILPQLLLCGLFIARDQMAPLLYAVSWALPSTYAYDALDRATSLGPLSDRILLDIAVLAGATALALTLGAATLRRCTA